MKNLIYVEKTDNIGARLRELVVALAFAEVTDKEMIFFWNNSAEWVKERNASDDLNLSAIFSEDFISHHYTDKSLKSIAFDYKVWPLSRKNRILLKKTNFGNPIRLIKVPKSNVFAELSEKLELDLLSRSFQKISFSPAIQQAINEGKRSVPKKSVAIHVRQGDVVTGEYRFWGNWTKKSIPIPVALRIAEIFKANYHNCLFISSDQDFLNKIAPNEQFKPTKKNGVSENLWRMFFDIGRISACEQVYAANDCNFALMGAWYAGKKVINPVSLINSSDVNCLIKEHIIHGSFLNNLDVAYFIQWLLINFRNAIEEKQARNLIYHASELDPQNPVYDIIKIADNIRQKKDEKTSAYAVSAIQKVNDMNNYVKMRFLADLGFGSKHILSYNDAIVILKYANLSNHKSELNKIASWIMGSSSYRQTKTVGCFKRLIRFATTKVKKSHACLALRVFWQKSCFL